MIENSQSLNQGNNHGRTSGICLAMSLGGLRDSRIHSYLVWVDDATYICKDPVETLFLSGPSYFRVNGHPWMISRESQSFVSAIVNTYMTRMQHTIQGGNNCEGLKPT